MPISFHPVRCLEFTYIEPLLVKYRAELPNDVFFDSYGYYTGCPLVTFSRESTLEKVERSTKGNECQKAHVEHRTITVASRIPPT